MEYIQGETLADIVERGVLAEVSALKYIMQRRLFKDRLSLLYRASRSRSGFGAGNY